MSRNIIKRLNFYYSCLDNKGLSIYRCLINDSTDIQTVECLDYKSTQNYCMNASYEESDVDLFRFRDDLKQLNDQVMNKLYFSKLNKTWFRINVFNYNTLNESILGTITKNIDQEKLKGVVKIDFREFCVYQNCLSAGLMTIDKDLIDQPMKCFGYDYSKYYYNIMKKIQMPICAPTYKTIKKINFDKLGFGIYRCKIICTNKSFWQCFNFNKTHHYTHNTIKILYQYADVYDIKFKLLQPDDKCDYNVVQYAKTIELKILMKQWFEIMDELLSRCKGSWLAKSFVSQAWGNLCKFNKVKVDEDQVNNYDWNHLDKVTYSDPYEYYNYKTKNGKYQLIKSDNAFANIMARMKPFLTEYCRLHIFNFISENSLADQVIRIQTDGIVFKKKYNFDAIPYAPIPEAKSTGYIKFHNLNSYYHICKKCNAEYKYDKNVVHLCS
jgi:hypothetical protein